MVTYKVGYLIGSLAAGSINRRLAEALLRLGPPELQLAEIPIRDLPLYNYDLDNDYPAEARALKEGIESSDALLFITPEYNRSIPGSLKNAIDWASHPLGHNSLTGKPSAMIGASIGALGTACAQQHLRNILSYCDAPQLSAPEAYIQFKPEVFGEDGAVNDPSTEEFLRGFLGAFASFVDRVVTSRHRQQAGVTR